MRGETNRQDHSLCLVAKKVEASESPSLEIILGIASNGKQIGKGCKPSIVRLKSVPCSFMSLRTGQKSADRLEECGLGEG